MASNVDKLKSIMRIHLQGLGRDHRAAETIAAGNEAPHPEPHQSELPRRGQVEQHKRAPESILRDRIDPQADITKMPAIDAAMIMSVSLRALDTSWKRRRCAGC